MSIFKDSFHPSIQEQLRVRQAAINNRTPQNLTYFNSRNAWIRLSSSVNVYKKDSPKSNTNTIPPTPTTEELKVLGYYDNTLAQQYILQGGILNYSYDKQNQIVQTSLRSGLGDFSYAYSNVGSDGSPYRLGIRPMPGITGVDIKSKGAYGSLREATINFQCWDIKQLEDLELLYMRPGYSLLLEWGWTPYLDNNGTLQTLVDYTDIISKEWTKEELFARQYAKSTDGKYYKDGKEINITGFTGNCDSMYGFIKNYSWKARMDGGYDCSTDIISMGEVMESLKVNYSPLSSKPSPLTYGLISKNITNYSISTSAMSDLSKYYTENVLAGLFYELREIVGQISEKGFGNADEEGHSFGIIDGKHNNDVYELFRVTLNIDGGENKENGTNKIGKSDEQIYITLSSLTKLLNNYVLLRDKKAGTPYSSLSVLEQNSTSFNDVTGEGYLLALAHPLEVSVDPTVCLIKSPLWIKGLNVKLTPPSDIDPNNGNPSPPAKYGSATIDDNWWKEIIPLVTAADKDNIPPYPDANKLINFQLLHFLFLLYFVQNL